MVTKYKKTIVTMPPGRVGIHLEDLVSDVSSTIVTAVSPSSPLAGMVFQGDSIICVNDVDVRKMDTLGLFNVFQKYSEVEKVVTIVRKSANVEEELMSVSRESLSIESEPSQSTKTSIQDDRKHSHKYQSDSIDKSSTSLVAKQSKSKRRHHRKKKGDTCPVLPAKEFKIEIINDVGDDGTPQQTVQNSIDRKGMKSGHVGLSCTESDVAPPLPPGVINKSLSDASCIKQKLPRMTGSTEGFSSNIAPIPVGFVFDDSTSNRSSFKKLYDTESNAQNTERSVQDDNIGHLPPSLSEVRLETNSTQDEVTTVTLPSQTEVSSPSGSNYWHEYLSSNSHMQEASPDERQDSFDSSDSSKDTEQGPINNQYEIVADAVVVNDPEIYDAELMHDVETPNEDIYSPNIVINNTYSPSDDESKLRQLVWWRRALSLQILILIAVIVGAGFIILGIVLGVKRAPSESTSLMNNIQNSNESTQLNQDDHSQISNVFLNVTTNHYMIEYKNGTFADAGLILPEYLNESMVEEGTTGGTTSTSTTVAMIKTELPTFTPTSILLVESTISATSSSTTTTLSSTTTPATTTTEMPDHVSTSVEPGTTSSTATSVITTEIATPVRVSGNDKCEDAISLNNLPAYRAGTTLMATPEFTSELEPLCGTILESKGVWYSFKSDSRTILHLEYEFKVQGLGESVLSIFTGSCDVGGLICYDTAIADYHWSENNDVAIYEFLPDVGETYLFLLSGINGDTVGEYEFRVMEHQIPSNDRCENSTKIITVPQIPLIFKGDTTGATPDFDSANVGIHGCAGMDWYTRGLWYQFTGKGTSVRLEYHMYSIGLGNSEISIFSGSCGDLVCVQNVEGEYHYSDYNDMASYEFFASKNQNYWFLLYGQNFMTAGAYEFKVIEYEVPTNDECVKASEVTVSAPFTKQGLSTLGATPDFDDSNIHSCVVDWYTRGVWYRVIGQGAVMRIEYQLYSEGMGNSDLAVFTGSCESLTCEVGVAGEWHYSGYNDMVVYEFLAEEGEVYFVWLSGENYQAAATYDLTISEYTIPTNDKCENASSISAGSLYSGTTAGSTPDFNAFDQKCGGTEDNRGVWYSFNGNDKLTSFSYTPLYDDAQLSLFSGTCDNLRCEGNYGTETSFSFVPISGRQYRVFLAGYSFEAVGDYGLSIEQYDQPSNDFCTNAVKMTSFPYTVEGNIKGATQDFNNVTVQCGDLEYSGVWYSFVGTGKTISLELKTAGTSSEFWGEIAVFQGQCGTFECIIQDESQGENAIVNSVVPSTAGAQYKVLIASWGLPIYDVSYQFSASEETS